MPQSAPNEEKYVLASVERSDAPHDLDGDDWFAYIITRGDHEITGFRRGKPRAVKADLKTLVETLNERRSGKPRGRAPAAATKTEPKNQAKTETKPS